jgi:catechol 2,3-dioxygenase-like lactoylglutathione lyase family enzyme
MTITGFDHYTIRCADLQAAWRFYAETLGLRVVDRPGMPVPAAIVYIPTNDMMLIHLFQATPEQDATFSRIRPPDTQWLTGRLQHVALQARGLMEFRQRLAQHGVAFTERTLERAGKHLVVLKDLDGVEIELSFALDELE